MDNMKMLERFYSSSTEWPSNMKKKCILKNGCKNCRISNYSEYQRFAENVPYCALDEIENFIEDTESRMEMNKEIMGDARPLNPVKFIDAGVLKVKVMFVVNGEHIKKPENDFVERLIKERGETKCVRGTGYGSPDLKVPIDEKIHKHYEVKSSSDGLRASQVEWMLNHPEEDVTLVYYYNARHQPDHIEENMDNIEGYTENASGKMREKYKWSGNAYEENAFVKCNECDGTGVVKKLDYEIELNSAVRQCWQQDIQIFKPTGNDIVKFMDRGILYIDGKKRGVKYIVKVKELNENKDPFECDECYEWFIDSRNLLDKIKAFIPLKGKTLNIVTHKLPDNTTLHDEWNIKEIIKIKNKVKTKSKLNENDNFKLTGNDVVKFIDGGSWFSGYGGHHRKEYLEKAGIMYEINVDKKTMMWRIHQGELMGRLIRALRPFAPVKGKTFNIKSDGEGTDKQWKVELIECKVK